MDTREHDLGHRLTVWMDRIGVSPRQLAEAGSVTRASISRYIQNQVEPSLHVLNAIVIKGLGMGLDRFWGPLPKPRKPTGRKMGRPRKLKPTIGARAA